MNAAEKTGVQALSFSPDIPPFDLPSRIDGWSVLLDVDGTLIDLAPTPEAVVIPPTMPRTLRALFDGSGGAISLVTGRTIETIDRLFAPERLPVAGVHGFEIRFGDGSAQVHPAPPALATVRPELARFVEINPGLLLEDKGSALAVHYRSVPDLGATVEGEVRRAVEAAGPGLHVQTGKMVVEVRPAGATKGTAAAAILSQPAFQGRRALAMGDDVTDEAMFEAVNVLGGVTIRIGAADRATAAQYRLPGPQAVRDWLALVAGKAAA